MVYNIKETSMKRAHKNTIVRTISIVLMIIAILAAYYCLTNWRAQYAYNSATSSLIANMKAAKNIDADKEVLLTQQQQTDAQFNDASAQRYLLMPKLLNHIDHNAKLSREFTEKLRKNINSTNKSTSSKNKNNQQKADTDSKKNKNNNEPNKPQLNNNQKSKVENLLKQNNHVDTENSQNQENQEDKQGQEKTTKRTNSNDNSNKPW